jgi:hypothetical protein
MPTTSSAAGAVRDRWPVLPRGQRRPSVRNCRRRRPPCRRPTWRTLRLLLSRPCRRPKTPNLRTEGGRLQRALPLAAGRRPVRTRRRRVGDPRLRRRVPGRRRRVPGRRRRVPGRRRRVPGRPHPAHPSHGAGRLTRVGRPRGVGNNPATGARLPDHQGRQGETAAVPAVPAGSTGPGGGARCPTICFRQYSAR